MFGSSVFIRNPRDSEEHINRYQFFQWRAANIYKSSYLKEAVSPQSTPSPFALLSYLRIRAMHVPSPSDYLPFDADANHDLRSVLLDNYLYMVLMVLMVYEHIITFDIEVERIWSLRWRLPKFLFIINRYVVPPLLVMRLLSDLVYPLLFSFCNFQTHMNFWIMVLALGASELILVKRVSALFGHSKIMWRFLVGLYVCQMVSVMVIISIITKTTTTVLAYEYFPGCYDINTTPNNYMRFIPFVIFDGILLCIMMFKVLTGFRQDHNRTVNLLARDSIVYFVVMFVAILVNVIMIVVPNGLVINFPPEPIACIAISRMMMNIRGLLFDDPHSFDLKLPTIQFSHMDVATGNTDDQAGLSTLLSER